MQKPDQVSLYFLDDLEQFRFFVNMSERHMKEESIRYSESDIETDEAVSWDRYQYRTDLSSNFDVEFPQYQKRSHLLMLVSMFEDYLNQLCHSIRLDRSLNCNLKDMAGSGVDRAKKYLMKIAKIQVPTESKDWNTIMEARDIRNVVAHNAGHLDRDFHKKHLEIIKRNPYLSYGEFSRVHINVEQGYLLEVISALENVAKSLWQNTK